MKRLSGWDAMLLYGETDNVPAHTLKVAVIDAGSAPDFTFEVFGQALRRQLPSLDPLRYELVKIPLSLHHPMWMQDCEVDLDYHLRHVTVPGSANTRHIEALISEIAAARLDRGRPLWEFTFVDGLMDSKVAVVAKVHHALADGVASANLLARAMDSSLSGGEAADEGTCARPSNGELLRVAARDHAVQLWRLPAVIRDTAAGVGRVRRRATERNPDPRLARPFAAPPTFINHLVSRGRRFSTATVALRDAKGMSKHLGITLNDLVLATCAGALRELQLLYDGRADEPLIASVPINTDPSPDRMSGNALGALFVSLPVHVSDPLERVRLTKLAAVRAKENNNLLGPELVGRWMEYMPPPMAATVLPWLARRESGNRLYNLSISNVRGPAQRAAIAGAPITEFYSVGPLTAGSGMNITVWSYVDQFNITVLTDDTIVSDAEVITAALLQSFDEIHHAAALPGGLQSLPTAFSLVPLQ